MIFQRSKVKAPPELGTSLKFNQVFLGIITNISRIYIKSILKILIYLAATQSVTGDRPLSLEVTGSKYVAIVCVNVFVE